MRRETPIRYNPQQRVMQEFKHDELALGHCPKAK